MRLLFPLLATIVVACAAASPAGAEEGGSGHYLPGAMASFIDAFPLGKPGFAVLNEFTWYAGDAGRRRTLPVGGLIAVDLDATSYAYTLLALYQTPWKLLGLDYGAALSIPYIWLDATANVTVGPRSGRRRDTADGFGDIVLLPLLLGWQSGDLKSALIFGVYAPTGGFDVGRLANPGKNYWTFEPSLSLNYLSAKTGFEVSAFAGLDFNTENEKTDYDSGDQFHLDVTLAEHLPLLGATIGIGANTFVYQQLDGDSGDGARLGDFEGRTVGIGPVLSYIVKIGGIVVAAEAKWLPEIEVEHRLKGDIVWFKLALFL
jgi:hypothetical protein